MGDREPISSGQWARPLRPTCQLLTRRIVDVLTVVAPTEHLNALSWREAMREAFEPAARRLALTGTPFRSDTTPIPFLTYTPDTHGVRRSRADYSYGYGHALRDGVVRPVIFLAYSGQLRWRTRAGAELTAIHRTLKELRKELRRVCGGRCHCRAAPGADRPGPRVGDRTRLTGPAVAGKDRGKQAVAHRCRSASMSERIDVGAHRGARPPDRTATLLRRPEWPP